MSKRTISGANDRGKWSRGGAITCSLPRSWLYRSDHAIYATKISRYISAETRCSNRALRRALLEIQHKPLEEGLGAVVQQEILRHNDTCHMVLTAVHAKVTEDVAAKEAAIREARMSASTAEKASKPAFSVSMGGFCHP